MNRRPKRTSRSPALAPCYSLKDVKRLICDNRFTVAGKTLRSAYDDFGWGKAEIRRFMLSLNPGHFYKRESATNCSTDYLDVYKAEMYGMRVYTHFYITDDGQLVIINSFKKDTSNHE